MQRFDYKIELYLEMFAHNGLDVHLQSDNNWDRITRSVQLVQVYFITYQHD